MNETHKKMTGGVWKHCVVAGLGVLAALLLRGALSPWLGGQLPFMLFAVAAMVAAWYGGLWPGLAAILAGGFLGSWLFLLPSNKLTFQDPNDWLRVLGFVLTSGVGVVLCGALHRSRRRLSQLAADLRAHGKQLQQELDTRRRSEQALREMGKISQRIIDSNVVGMMIADFAGNIIDANDAFLELVGYSREDLEVGRLNFFELTPHHLRHLDQRALEQLRIRGKHEPYEKQYLRKDGHAVPVLVGIAFLPAETELGVSYVVDLTEQKRAQRVVRDSEYRYRFLAESIPQIVWTARPDGVTNYNNRRLFEYFGVTADDAQKLGWLHFRHPEDREEATIRWRHSIKTGEPYECRYRLLRASDQTYRWHLARAVPMRDDAGQIVMWFGTCTDIDDEKRALDAVKQSEERFRLAARAVNGVVYDWDVNNRTVFRSEGLHVLVGVQPADAPQSDEWWLSLIHPQDLARVQPLFSKLLETGEDHYAYEYRIQHHDGSWIDVWDHGFLIRDDTGHLIRVVGSATDISQRKRVEQELADANRAKDQFLATLSHELRTPLTPVVLAIDSLRGDPSVPEAIRDDLEMIQRNVGLESRLIDDLLDHTRITRGRLELHKEVVDAHATIERAMSSGCAAEIQAKRLALDVDLSATEQRVRADPVRLEQVFVNLLRNAVKFTGEGGSIRWRTSNDLLGHITIDVSDDGIGIASHLLPRIFDAFERGQPAATRHWGGLGVGLAVCRTIVELHGGSIRAHSDGPGRGATFTVQLPVIERPAENAADQAHYSEAGDPDAPRRGARILVVEDDQPTARVMCRLLDRLRHDVKVASDVASARKLAREHQFDLVLSDLGLPDGSGLDLMRELRQEFDLRGIAVTGFGMEEDFVQSKSAGFVEHLVKPVRFSTLEAALARVLEETPTSASVQLPGADENQVIG